MATGRTGRFSTSILTAYFLTVAAFYAASFFPEARLWGINWFGFFDWYGPVAFLLAALLLPIALNYFETTETSSRRPSLSYTTLAIVILVLLTAAFVIFRGRTHFLGDGYQIINWLATSGKHNKPWAAGVHAVQLWIYQGLAVFARQPALLAAQLYSYLAGVIFVGGAALVAARLFDRTRERIILLLGLCSGGQMLLYFGYVENYPLFVSVIGLFGLVGLGVARRQLARIWLVIVLGLAVALHIFGVVVIPAAIYLLVRETKFGRKLAALPSTVRWGSVLLGAAIAVAVFLYAYTQNYFFRFTVVPFVDSILVAEGYTMFSAAHLLDYGNLLWQLVPALVIFVVVIFLSPVRALLIRPDYRFLLLLLAPSLVMSFIFQPGLGMPRDWDLFSFTAVPALLLGFYTIIDNRERLPGYFSVSILAIGLGFMLLIPRVATQVIPEKGIAVFVRMAALDDIRNRKGRAVLIDYLTEHGDTARSEALRDLCTVKYPQERWYEEARYLAQQHQYEKSVDKLRDVVNVDPTYGHGWAGLGLYHYDRGRYDSAVICWQIASAVTPFNADHIRQLGMGYAALGDSAKAEDCWVKSMEMDSSDVSALLYLVALYREQGREKEYAGLLSEIVERPDVPLGILIEYADHRAYAGDFEAAEKGFRRALELGLDSAYVLERQAQYPGLEVIGD